MTRNIQVDSDRIGTLARFLATVAPQSAISFTGESFPPIGDPAALKVLALATLHQYGFWDDDDQGYLAPMYGTVDGRRLKGSDFVWATFARASRDSPELLELEVMARSVGLVSRLCVDDAGQCPLPDLDSHEALQRGYAQAMLEIPGGMEGLVERCNQETRPGAALLEALGEIPGYREDPLAKKANLLVIILSQRPERFLDLRDPESVQPIVDYHMMRGCLRTGAICVSDGDLSDRLERRQWVTPAEETLIRETTHAALTALVEESGRTVGEVDGFFFRNGRSYCLEMEEPRCNVCPAAEHCAQLKNLFQPVFRTTAY